MRARFILGLMAASLAFPVQAERVRVPAGADVAKLDAATKRCVVQHPDDDSCYDLFMALGRALIAAGKYAEAREALETARKSALGVYDGIADAYDDALGQAEVQKVPPEQINPDFPRLARLHRQMWQDIAEAGLLRAEAAEAEGQLLDAAAGFDAYWSIHTNYVKDPAKAERALAMGLRGVETYLAAGSADKVESILRHSLPRAEESFGKDNPTIIAMLVVWGRAQSAMGKYQEADATFADARARAARTTDRMLQADADTAYAVHLLSLDRAREALDLQRPAVLKLEAAKAPPKRMARAYLEFAEVSTGQEALDLAARAVDMHVAAYGAEHLLTARARVVAAGLLDREGRADLAESERATGIAVLSKRLSILSPEIALAKLRQAENLALRGRCEEVMDLARYALDAFIYFGGDGITADSGKAHPNTARALFLMGLCEMRTTPGSAMERLKRAAAIQRAVLSRTHPERMQTEMALGMIAQAQGNIALAMRQLRLVADAGQERVRSYPSFDADAQREQRQFSPVYLAIVQTAWIGAQGR